MPTRRRNNHARQPSNPIPASDYESDAPPYNPHAPHHHAAARTHTERNLGVLRRYVPAITAILSVAANAVVYTFDAASRSWEKSGVEGTLFVCAREPGPEPRFCVLVLNRRGLDTLILGLEAVRDVEVTDDLLIFGLGAGEGEGGSEAKALGVWMHADAEDTRKLNMNIIHGLWEQVRDARGPAEGDGIQAYGGGEESVGPAVQAIGKTLSVDELFASQTRTGFGR